MILLYLVLAPIAYLLGKELLGWAIFHTWVV